VIKSFPIQSFYLFWVLALLQLPVLAHAQEYLVNGRTFTTADGLSNDQILSLLQDDEGFIWIGTKYGLNRFDGYTFRTFTKTSHGLQSSVINELMKGPGGYIWVIRVQTSFGSRTYFTIDLLDPIKETVVSWKDAFPSSPFRLDQVKRIFDVPEGILLSVKGQGYYLVDRGQSLQTVGLPNDFQFISAPEQGQFFGKLHNQYVTLNRDGEKIRSINLQDSLIITKAVADHKGNYWCIAGKKPLSYSSVQLSSLLRVSPSGSYTVEDQLDASDANVIFKRFRKGHALLYIKPDEIREYDLDHDQVFINREAMEGRPIVSPGLVFVDQNDGLWIGDYFGLRLFDTGISRFTTYLKNEEEPVSARGMTVKGQELIYTKPGGPHRLDLSTRRKERIEERDPIMVFPTPFSVLRLESGQLLFGGKQMIAVDNQYQIYKVSDFSALRYNRIWSFAQDTEGYFWTGLGDKYIAVLQPDLESYRLVESNGYDDAAQATKWHFFEDGDYIWVAAQNGLYLIRKEKGVVAQFGANAQEDYYLPAITFHHIHKDSQGNYWLATGDGGLIRFSYDLADPKSLSYKQYKKEDGLPSLELYAILEDEKGFFWVSTANGLMQFNPKTEEVFVYREEQGIAHNEFNRLSYYQHTDGKIYLGGLNGITAFDPADFHEQERYEAPLKVAAASLLSFGVDSLKNIRPDLLEGEALTLQPRDNFLNLSFSLQDYPYSDQAKYSYRIPGVQSQWTAIAGHQLQLAGLPYGTHTLEVRAQGRMNNTSTDQLQIKLIVLRPIYLRWWFIGLILLLAIVSVWGYIDWRNKSLIRRKLALERMVAERTKTIQKDKQLIEEQAMQLRELDEMKSQFFENVSHELRTPLTLILGPLDKVLKRDKLDNRDFTLLTLMKENAKSLHKRINELLDLSSIDAVRMSVHPQPVELYTFVKNTLSQFESSAGLHSLTLLLEFKLDQELRVMLDPDKVEKILYNLLSNAIKFTPPEGEVKLVCNREAGKLTFHVIDTGIGIPAADLSRVFERFHRVNNDTKYKGTGIGLALSKELAELMEGELSVSSTQGEGSTFVLKIPLQETFVAAPTPQATPLTSETSDLLSQETDITGDPILVVEDNPSLSGYLQLILEDFHVKTAGHGQEALRILAEGFSPALIITDIMMPVMDGMELLQAIRDNDAYRSLPVIMLTAKTASTNKVEALRIGVDDYLTKPFVEEELIARVQALIRNSRQRMATNNHSPEKKPSVVSKADLKWLEEVENFILSRVGDKTFGIDQLADLLHLSTRRLQQKIKAITGMTPKQYQREIYLEAARRKLESGVFQSVSELSQQLGFSDAHYFSKLYEKRFGKRPSDYL
jgi:signal transduction histidine kinase/DNA-binding response OmpR family regulator/ligand-binding sensor domain-containing protein